MNKQAIYTVCYVAGGSLYHKEDRRKRGKALYEVI